MVIKILTLAIAMLLVGCGGAPGGGSGGNDNGNSNGGSNTPKDSAELSAFKKDVADNEILILFNSSTYALDYMVGLFKSEATIKTNKAFSSNDVNCKSFGFSRISSGDNGGIKERGYVNKDESKSNTCNEKDFINANEAKGDKNYIIIGQKK